MKIVENLLLGLPQIAVFDTGLHRQMPVTPKIYPGPYEWFENGIHATAFTGSIINTVPDVPHSCWVGIRCRSNW